MLSHGNAAEVSVSHFFKFWKSLKKFLVVELVPVADDNFASLVFSKRSSSFQLYLYLVSRLCEPVDLRLCMNAVDTLVQRQLHGLRGRLVTYIVYDGWKKGEVAL